MKQLKEGNPFNALIEPALVLSTGHIDPDTAHDLNVLYQGEEAALAGEGIDFDSYLTTRRTLGHPICYEYGWFFNPTVVLSLADEGVQIPHCILMAANLAKKMEATLLVFDRDKKACNWLPVYDW